MHHQRIAIAQVVQRCLKLGALSVLVYRANAEVTDVLALAHDSFPWPMCQVGVHNPASKVSINDEHHPIPAIRDWPYDSQARVYLKMKL